jgi:hypothetical protein
MPLYSRYAADSYGVADGNCNAAEDAEHKIDTRIGMPLSCGALGSARRLGSTSGSRDRYVTVTVILFDKPGRLKGV